VAGYPKPLLATQHRARRKVRNASPEGTLKPEDPSPNNLSRDKTTNVVRGKEFFTLETELRSALTTLQNCRSNALLAAGF
jgi:hypothetical protein